MGMSAEVRRFLSKPFEAHQKEFTDYKLSKLPDYWRQDALHEYNEILKNKGIKAANDWLNELTDPLEMLLNIAHDDDDIKSLSKEVAFKVRDFATKKPVGELFRWMQKLCKGYAVRYPDEHDRYQILARLSCENWWLRQLRVAHARAREMCAINAGLVNRKKNLYVSDDTLDRRQQQNRRNQKTLSEIEMRSESGQVMKLSDIAATGMANHENRRNELMTRIHGFEELSIKYNHKAEFVTVTCPSRMHAVLSNGTKNPKYDGTKPHEAQAYLVKVWARVRAKLHRDGLKVYGLRVAEPHHDGTPHWHLILFYRPDFKGLVKAALRRVIKAYFLADNGDEKGAEKNRVKFVSINPLKGTACGYVAKYVAKNIGGIEGEKADEADMGSEDASARVEAWASTWRIRQFQQIGGHYVTVWRELRRIDESDAKRYPQIFTAWQTAQKIKDKAASFAAYIESMGGLDMAARESLLAVDDDYVTKRGRYGETIARVIKGVRERWGLAAAKTNRETWERV